MNWQWMMGTARNRSFWRVTLAVALTLASSALIRATAKEPTVDELKARLSSTNIGNRPQLCLQIAERQLQEADKLYAAVESEKAQATLTDVVAFSELARDYSLQSHKHQKQTEIAVRRMTRKLTDLKHVVTHEEQPAVQEAIDKLERVRDDLLLAMFPKKGDK
ncbi:MAG: hypothetical protein DMG77_03270 [Acidobacteria bacterium]|nr:MAG: hypothetical protein DMG77_03270 [Acidobacteriota bacterium]